MRVPIAYALAWPERMATPGRAARPGRDRPARLRSARPGALPGAAPRPRRRSRRAAPRRPSSTPPTRSRSAAFLDGRIGFLDIAALVERGAGSATTAAAPALDRRGAGDRPRGPRARRRTDRGKLPLMLEQPPASWFILLAFLCVDRAAHLHPRARPLSRRPLVRGGRRDLLDRLRPRDRRLDRQARHALEGRLAAARRLCPLRRRHEPGERAGDDWRRCPPRSAPRSFQAKPVWQRFLIVLAGPVTNFLFAIADLRGVLRQPRRCRARPPSSASIQPDSAAAARRLPARATGSSRSTARDVDSFEDLPALSSRCARTSRCQRRARARRRRGASRSTPRVAAIGAATGSATRPRSAGSA